MNKIFLGIPLLFVALAVACAQQSGGDRQTAWVDTPLLRLLNLSQAEQASGPPMAHKMRNTVVVWGVNRIVGRHTASIEGPKHRDGVLQAVRPALSQAPAI